MTAMLSGGAEESSCALVNLQSPLAASDKNIIIITGWIMAQANWVVTATTRQL